METEQDRQVIAVYLEVGAKRTVAGALAWPGWCRVARDEAAALQALVDYAPRYGRVLDAAGSAFPIPHDPTALAVTERLAGGSGTDFGVPEMAPTDDALPMDAAALRKAERVLRACWQAFDAAVEAATEKTLRRGPRSGGGVKALSRPEHGSQCSDLRWMRGSAASEPHLRTACDGTRRVIVKLLLTSGGVTNPSIQDALIDLLGKPIADCDRRHRERRAPRVGGVGLESISTSSWCSPGSRATGRRCSRG